MRMASLFLCSFLGTHFWRVIHLKSSSHFISGILVLQCIYGVPSPESRVTAGVCHYFVFDVFTLHFEKDFYSDMCNASSE